VEIELSQNTLRESTLSRDGDLLIFCELRNNILTEQIASALHDLCDDSVQPTLSFDLKTVPSFLMCGDRGCLPMTRYGDSIAAFAAA
jgi:hypothetical protein